MGGEPRERAFFGRRKGKRLRAGQDDLVRTLLPALRVDPGGVADLRRSFDGLAIEIGFGGGEHLLARARSEPNTAFLGCEPFVNGVAKVLAAIDAEGLGNIRLWDDDVMGLLPALPEGAIGRVAMLYPDPWPKRRQRKRRLFSDELLRMLARAMRPGAELRFATDIDDYAGWALARVMRSGDFRWTAARADDWRRPWPDWPGTRYEAKAIRAGRVPSYLTFERR